VREPLPPPVRLLKIKEVAATLNVHERTIRRRIASGHIRVFRSGRIVRIYPSELSKFLSDDLSA
jgi:excisionase family DNA binding protein